MKNTCTAPKRFLNNTQNRTILQHFSNIIPYNLHSSRSKQKKRRPKPPLIDFLLSPERLAVGALVHSRISLVSTNQNALQRAVVGLVAMVSALLNGTFDGLVCIFVHFCSLLLLSSFLGCPRTAKAKHGKDRQISFVAICAKK